tara:strand:- start:3261 stop:3695 length:435 start_codon:yes stop_codon:yes gene_type:complete
MKETNSRKSGFTLVEAMVGLTLLVMVLASGFAAYALGIRMTDSGRQTLRATQFAQSKLEEIRTKNWNDLESMYSWSIFYPDTSFAPEHMDDYIGILEIHDLNSTQKRIRCWAYWPSKRGRYYDHELFETVFTKNGLNDYFVRAF